MVEDTIYKIPDRGIGHHINGDSTS
jgi:hypothetical protein